MWWISFTQHVTAGGLTCPRVSDGEVQSFPVGKVDNVVDTNGAGDAFVGGEQALW